MFSKCNGADIWNRHVENSLLACVINNQKPQSCLGETDVVSYVGQLNESASQNIGQCTHHALPFGPQNKLMIHSSHYLHTTVSKEPRQS